MKKITARGILIGLCAIFTIAISAVLFSGCAGNIASLCDDGVLSYRIADDKSYCIVEKVIDNSATEITIPNNYNNIPIKIIGQSAFSRCINLVSITIPESVTSIDRAAFDGCTSLTNIALPGSLTTISDCAFRSCRSLGGITIPESVTSIGEAAFDGCTSLTSITIPNSVTTISGYMFRYCKNLETITIHANVTDIGSCAFDGCTGLKKVYITDIVAWCNISFGEFRSNPLEYAENLYLNGEFVKELVIPSGVTGIAPYAFYGYSSLSSITIPVSVTSVGYEAFKGCLSLKNVYITDLAEWCNISFDHYEANPLNGADNFYLNGELVREIAIPSNVTTIAPYAFYGYTELSSVVIPDSVTSIGMCAFSHCTDLVSVAIPDSVKSIGDYVFYNCNRLKNLAIGRGVRSIGTYVFERCKALKSIRFNGAVEEWNLIDKKALWDYNANFSVFCTDGTISEKGVVTYY